VTFPRILVVTGVFAATASVIPGDLAAQSLTIDETVAVQTTWMSGYMGLGGGLARAMPKPSEKKPSDKKIASASPERRVVRRPAPQIVRRSVPSKAPIALIAETLDHTGENIATLGAQTAQQ